MEVIIILLVSLLVLAGVGFGIRALIRAAGQQQQAVVKSREQYLTELGGRPAEHPRTGSFHMCFTEGQRAVELLMQGGKSPYCILAVELPDIGGGAAATAGSPFRDYAGTQLGAPKLELRPETRWDRLGKALRINRELQVGDPQFDEQVYLESDAADEILRRILAAPEVRRATVGLLGLGCSLISLNNGQHRLAARWSKYPWPDPAQIRAAAQQLDALAAGLPAISAWPKPPALSRGGRIIGYACLAAAVGILLTFVGRSAYRPLTDELWGLGVLAGAVAWLLLVPLVLLLVKGRSNGLRAFMATSCVLLVGCPTLICGGLALINGAFDTAPRQIHQAQILRRYIQRGSKGSVTRYVKVAPWPPHAEAIRLRLTADEFARTPDKGTVAVRTGRGALGYEWLAGIGEP